MERLTAREDGRAYYPHCFREDGCDGDGGDWVNCDFGDMVCEHLAAYEDLGLTPDEIRRMDKLYQEKCEELARIKAALDKAREIQQEDEKLYLDSYNAGWVDAVKFIEGRVEER